MCLSIWVLTCVRCTCTEPCESGVYGTVCVLHCTKLCASHSVLNNVIQFVELCATYCVLIYLRRTIHVTVFVSYSALNNVVLFVEMCTRYCALKHVRQAVY